MKKFSGVNDITPPVDNGEVHENGQNGEIDIDPPIAEPEEHKLQFAYVLWFSHRPGGKTLNAQPYDQNLKVIGAFNTVEKFWSIYGHIIRPSEMAVHSDYHLFKYGIRPLWEDEANKAGGKWIVRLKKGLASRCWEDLILAILGEQFMVGEEICGAVVSVRFQEDIISVWNKTAGDQHTTIRIRDTLKRVLNLPTNTIMEYKTHNDSLRVFPSQSQSPLFTVCVHEVGKDVNLDLQIDDAILNQNLKHVCHCCIPMLLYILQCYLQHFCSFRMSNTLFFIIFIIYCIRFFIRILHE